MVVEDRGWEWVGGEGLSEWVIRLVQRRTGPAEPSGSPPLGAPPSRAPVTPTADRTRHLLSLCRFSREELDSFGPMRHDPPAGRPTADPRSTRPASSVRPRRTPARAPA